MTGGVNFGKLHFVFSFMISFKTFNSEHAEADTFFCFTGLMAEIRDFFIKTLDESEVIRYYTVSVPHGPYEKFLFLPTDGNQQADGSSYAQTERV